MPKGKHPTEAQKAPEGITDVELPPQCSMAKSTYGIEPEVVPEDAVSAGLCRDQGAAARAAIGLCRSQATNQMQAQVQIKLLRHGQPQACAEAKSRAHSKEHPAHSSLAKVAKKVAIHDGIIRIEVCGP